MQLQRLIEGLAENLTEINHQFLDTWDGGSILGILLAVNILNLLYSCRDPPAGAGSVGGREGGNERKEKREEWLNTKVFL